MVTVKYHSKQGQDTLTMMNLEHDTVVIAQDDTNDQQAPNSNEE